MLAVVLLEIALGSLALLWVTPVWGVVKRGFFLLVGYTAAACAIFSRLAFGAGGRAGTALWVFAGLATAFTAALQFRQSRLARVLGMLAVPAGVAAVLVIADLRGDGSRAVTGAAAMLTGAAFLGATWNGMVLGHWYLVDRKLTNRPMKAYALAFSIGIALALVSASFAKGGQPTAAEASLNPLLYVSGLTVYLAFGLVAVNALLAFFVHKLVNEGSIRAATGMLYLAVILSWSAEFAAKARFFTL